MHVSYRMYNPCKEIFQIIDFFFLTYLLDYLTIILGRYRSLSYAHQLIVKKTPYDNPKILIRRLFDRVLIYDVCSWWLCYHQIKIPIDFWYRLIQSSETWTYYLIDLMRYWRRNHWGSKWPCITCVYNEGYKWTKFLLITRVQLKKKTCLCSFI